MSAKPTPFCGPERSGTSLCQHLDAVRELTQQLGEAEKALRNKNEAIRRAMTWAAELNNEHVFRYLGRALYGASPAEETHDAGRSEA